MSDLRNLHRYLDLSDNCLTCADLHRVMWTARSANDLRSHGTKSIYNAIRTFNISQHSASLLLPSLRKAAHCTKRIPQLIQHQATVLSALSIPPNPSRPISIYNQIDNTISIASPAFACKAIPQYNIRQSRNNN